MLHSWLLWKAEEVMGRDLELARELVGIAADLEKGGLAEDEALRRLALLARKHRELAGWEEETRLRLPEPAEAVVRRLEEAGYTAVVAGGFFHPPYADVDVFVNEFPGDGVMDGLSRDFEVDYNGRVFLLRPREPGNELRVQVVPTAFSGPEELLARFDLGASQAALYRGKFLETPEHRRAVRERRPLVLSVGPTTVRRVLKYAGKGFENFEQDLAVAVVSLLRGLALLPEAERQEFFFPYDRLSFAFREYAELLAPALLLVEFTEGKLQTVPLRAWKPLPRPERGRG